ncbi:hypothetical protein EDC01DRAFT_628478 [Geopyxis carbonaria]|nr:hypothetical protein EDC01DRAFT_628478 [Geopyxis carbonaria]
MSALAGSMQRRLFPHQNIQTDQTYLGKCPSYEDAVNPENQRRIPTTTPYLTPYLGLQARLSQVWFNRWTVLLFLILVRVILATISLDSDLESARDKALSACTGVESMGSAMASMPHYMSKGVNEMAAIGIETAVHALQETLLLMITAIQEIVIFIINLVTSTYLCLITLAVKGSVGVVADVTSEITDGINNFMGGMVTSIEDEIKDAQELINKALDGIESVGNFFGAKNPIPDVSIPSIDKLKSYKIPDTFSKKVKELENDIPDFKEVQKAANDVIRIPFQKIQKLVESQLKIYKFDRSNFPIPEKEKMTFCSDNPTINNFFNKLVALVHKVRNILIGIIVTLAILVMGPMAYRDIHNWRTMRSRAYMLTDSTREFDPVDVVHIASHPAPSTFGLRVANYVKPGRRQVLVRWAISYITSPPALFVLSLGVAGLAGVLCQVILLKQVESKAPELAAEIGEFAGLVVDKLNASSRAWGEQTNKAITSTNEELNDELFGWVKDGTDAMNDTLNTLVDKMSEGVETAFGGTPLENPVKDVLKCLIGYKIEGIQKALTWAHDHAQITFPTLPVDTFSLGALDSLGSDSPGSESFLSNPDSAATDQITDVVVKLTKKWENMLTQEAAISGAVTAIWFIVLLIALIRVFSLWWGRDPHRGEGGVAPNPHTDAHQNPFADQHARSANFPVFATSPNDAYPQTPCEFVDEKGEHHIQMGTVRSGTSNLEDGANRKSLHTKLDYRN